MRIFTYLFDKMVNRFITMYLDRADERNLHPHVLLLAQAQKEAADYATKNMKTAVIYKSRKDIIGFAIDRAPEDGMILEFGVGNGDSLRLLASKTKKPVHGFDSFEGLPEDWGGRHEEKGHYSTGGVRPHVPGNVVLHKGWFEQTVPDFMQNNPQAISLLHVDCDLYSSTKTVLDAAGPQIGVGTIIIFDEYFNYVSWREHEFKAFQEFVTAHKVRYSYLCWGYQQVVVRIDRIGSA